MEIKSLTNFTENNNKNIRKSTSLIFPYNNKIHERIWEGSENNTNINKNIGNNKNNILNKIDRKENHLLILHKINIKDKKYKFYKKGVEDIFNDENLFLNDKYMNNRVIVGRNKSSKFKPNYISNLHSKKNLGSYNKFRYYLTSSIKNNLLGKNKRNELSKSIKRKNLIDKNLINTYDYPDNNNYSICSSNSRCDNLRKSLNIFGKRSSIFFTGQNLISDHELKMVYQQFLEREKDNKKKELNNKDKENTNKNINKNIGKSTINKEIKSRLNLQEKILNKYKFTNKENQKLINKILKHTSKNNNDILLMNQIDDYRYKMEKIDEDKRMNQDSIYNNTIYWLSSLGNYSNNKIKKGEEGKMTNNSNNSTFPSIYSYMRKTNNNSKEAIYDNYINNFQYSFGSNSTLYCDLESSIPPLYAFILSDNLKNNEKIRNTHIDNNYYLNNKNNSFINYKLKKNISVPSLNNQFNIKEKNNIKDLNVEGKRLIDLEIEMSKNLEGKKKRLIKANYNDDETDTKTFAYSTVSDIFNFPKAVKNALELHSNKDIQNKWILNIVLIILIF